MVQMGRAAGYLVLMGQSGASLSSPLLLPLVAAAASICADGPFPDMTCYCYYLPPSPPPTHTCQAGHQGVDILLQPSWTWGLVGPRHWAGDALRAVENGFTLFR